MRTLSVSEELLPISPAVLRLAPLRAEMVLRHELNSGAPAQQDRASTSHSALSVELVGEKIRIVGPQTSEIDELLDAIRSGRALADRAALAQERRAVALGSPVFNMVCSRYEDRTNPRPDTGLMPRDGPTCGFRIHVQIDSAEEGVQILDRIRVWAPVLLALSTNSPFRRGRPTRSNSFRYYSRFKSAALRTDDVSGFAEELFGSADEYERRRRHLTHPAAARLKGVKDLDVQLSATRETLDVIHADVCMDAAHAAALAVITRALVEVMERQWREGVPPIPMSASDLRAASSIAAMNGLEGNLVSPTSGRMRPAKDVATKLLRLVQPVLVDHGEADWVTTAVNDLLLRGNGSRHQREAYAQRRNPHDVVDVALRETHHPHVKNTDSAAMLAETWKLVDIEEASVDRRMEVSKIPEPRDHPSLVSILASDASVGQSAQV